MDLKTAENLLALLAKSKAETWTVRRPTPEMIARFGEQGLHPFIEQPREKGEAVATEVLAEDYSGNDKSPIYDFQVAVERVSAAAKAAREANFFLTARAENYLHDRPDLEDTIRRLRAFADAGADAVYAPGLTSLDDIRKVCASVSKPVNVLAGMPGTRFSIEELAAAGVNRISVGGSMARAALGALVRAAHEIKDKHTFTFAADALPSAEVKRYLRATQG